MEIEEMKRAMEECNWKSVIFYCDEIIDRNLANNNLEVLFCKSFALYATQKYQELEQWMCNLPRDIQQNIDLLDIRCKTLLNMHDYEKIITLLGGIDEEMMLSEPLLPNELVLKSEHLLKYRKLALFNTEKSEEPPEAPKQANPTDGDIMHPTIITKNIITAMMKKDPSLLHQYTLMSDPRSESDPYIITACGCSHVLCGQVETGQMFFSKAAESDPECDIAWLCMVSTFIDASDWDQGLSTIKKIHQRFPDNESVAMFAIGLHLRSGSPALAQEWLSRVGPVSDFVRHEQAVAHLMEGQVAAAEGEFKAILSRTSERDLRAAAALNLGHCQRRLGKLEEALKSYEDSISFGAKQSEALASIAFTYHLLGRIDDAICFYNKCLSVDPVHPFATRMLDVALENATDL